MKGKDREEKGREDEGKGDGTKKLGDKIAERYWWARTGEIGE